MICLAGQGQIATPQFPISFLLLFPPTGTRSDVFQSQGYGSLGEFSSAKPEVTSIGSVQIWISEGKSLFGSSIFAQSTHSHPRLTDRFPWLPDRFFEEIVVKLILERVEAANRGGQARTAICVFAETFQTLVVQGGGVWLSSGSANWPVWLLAP
ncbi:MAG: hypothetical protein NZ602_12570 [Thermoguttaceae bacterium]|nr:hypothetical protein [Thermoguttaceae bacterium]MDW8037316.1 hypothetical protein [Thermoguttaceae bacterium]